MHPGGLDTVTCGIQTPLVLLKAGVMCHGITQRNGMVTAPGENPGAERRKRERELCLLQIVREGTGEAAC